MKNRAHIAGVITAKILMVTCLVALPIMVIEELATDFNAHSPFAYIFIDVVIVWCLYKLNLFKFKW